MSIDVDVNGKQSVAEDRVSYQSQARLSIAIQRSGQSKLSIAKKVCELGGSLNDTQLQKLENEDKANLGLLK